MTFPQNGLNDELALRDGERFVLGMARELLGLRLRRKNRDVITGI